MVYPCPTSAEVGGGTEFLTLPWGDHPLHFDGSFVLISGISSVIGLIGNELLGQGAIVWVGLVIMSR